MTFVYAFDVGPFKVKTDRLQLLRIKERNSGNVDEFKPYRVAVIVRWLNANAQSSMALMKHSKCLKSTECLSWMLQTYEVPQSLRSSKRCEPRGALTLVSGSEAIQMVQLICKQIANYFPQFRCVPMQKGLFTSWENLTRESLNRLNEFEHARNPSG